MSGPGLLENSELPPLPALLGDAFAATQRLLSGPGSRARWAQLGLAAAMAGIVGAGAAPPPLGLLQPVWDVPETRHELLSSPLLQGLGIVLVLLLVGMGAFGRSFTLAFLSGIRSGSPRAREFRAHLSAGARHFAWSSALSIPLYLLLFAGEWFISRDAWGRVTALLTGPSDPAPGRLLAALVSAGLKFVLVLLPWTLLTLPLMVWMYELTPAGMAGFGLGPVAAARVVLQAARKAPARWAGYLTVRLGLQFAGNLLALLAMIPSLLVAGLVSAPLLAGGWSLSHRAGGMGTTWGAFWVSLPTLLAVLLLYLALCFALLPVAVFLNALALRMFSLLPKES